MFSLVAAPFVVADCICGISLVGYIAPWLTAPQNHAHNDVDQLCSTESWQRIHLQLRCCVDCCTDRLVGTKWVCAVVDTGSAYPFGALSSTQALSGKICSFQPLCCALSLLASLL